MSQAAFTSPSSTVSRPWLLQLNSTERSTLIGTFTGWMLDGMDVMVYSFVLPSLILLWHFDKGKAGLLGTSALLLSSLGGWVAGLAADRFGRVRVLQLTIVWFAVFTFLSGFAQNFSQLLVLRGLQGLGFGGEWAVGSVLIGETVRAQYRGRAVGTVHEPDVYLEAQPAGFPTRHTILHIFSPSVLRVTLLASLVALGAQGGYYAINTWLPLYLQTRHLSVMHTTGYLSVVIAGSFAGYLTGAHLADYFGRKATLILFAACSGITVALYAFFPISDELTLLLGFPLGFFPSGSFSPMGAFFTELFPTALRGSGQGFAYNLGRGFGAFFPTLVGYFSAHVALGRAIASFAASAYVLMTIAVLLLPEMRGSDLAEIPDV